MSPILVTGANGFVGQHLGRQLADQGHEVVAALRNPQARLDYPVQRRETVGDIGPGTDWHRALEGVEVVIHLAARGHVMNEHRADPMAEFRNINTAGTLQLAGQAVAAGVRRLVYVSTIKVNGEASHGPPFRESDPVAPQDPYARSKHEAEQQLFALMARTGLEVVVVRPPLVYGPGVKGNFLRLMKLVDRALPLPLASIDNRRSLVNVWNLCSLLIRCCEHERAPGEVFLVADGEDLSTPELLRRLAAALHRPSRLWPFPPVLLAAFTRLLGQQASWERLAASLQVDIRKAQQWLDWQPGTPVNAALAATADGYRQRVRE